jgi:hypothetical protein
VPVAPVQERLGPAQCDEALALARMLYREGVSVREVRPDEDPHGDPEIGTELLRPPGAH